jgi:PAS domain S-box-containing protein
MDKQFIKKLLIAIFVFVFADVAIEYLKYENDNDKVFQQALGLTKITTETLTPYITPENINEAKMHLRTIAASYHPKSFIHHLLNDVYIHLFRILLFSGTFILFVLLFRKKYVLPIDDLTEKLDKMIINDDFSERFPQEKNHRFPHFLNSINRLLNELYASQVRQKQTMDAFRNSEEKYKKLVDISPDAIVVHREGEIIFANKSACALAGVSNEQDLIGKDLLLFVPKKHQAAIKERIEEALNSQKTTEMIEEELQNMDGKTVNVLASSVLIVLENKPAVMVILRDITKLKDNERMIKAREDQLSTVLGASNDPMYIIQDNRMMYINSKFTELFGYSETEVLDKKFDIMNIVAQEDRPFIEKRRISSKLGNPENNRYQFNVVAKSGAKLNVEANVSYITWNKRPAIFGILRDYTEKNTLFAQLQQAQKMEAIGKLAGGIAHDFNNLLTVIGGNAELIRLNTDLNDTDHKFINEIYKAAQKAQNLTKQLLAFSRQQVIQPKIVNINDIISEITKMLRRLIGEHIDLRIRRAARLYPVKMDPGQLDQILMNLVVNARDAIAAHPANREEPFIEIKTSNTILTPEFQKIHQGAFEGPCVLLQVTDNGCGMDQELQTKIYEPLFTTKKNGEGTGLGLSTVYGIVKQNSAWINVESAKGKGAVFSIYWPASHETQLSDELTEGEDKVKKGNAVVLLVEDDDEVREFMALALRMFGYKVYETSGAEEAHQLFLEKQTEIQVLVSDVVMPGMGGQYLAKQLTEIKNELKVIFVSGYSEAEITNAPFSNDMINFIQKPFAITELANVIEEVLD